MDHPEAVDSFTKWDSTAWTGRVVVGEYFTGVYCGFCQPRERAFDALIQRYPSTAFIALAYHFPPSVPLANPSDSLLERVEAWYGKPGEDSTEGLFGWRSGQEWDDWIDGLGTSSDNCDNPGCPTLYGTMAKAIDADLHKEPEAVLHAEATPRGGKVVAKVQVTSLSPSNRDVYVRMLVVEDTVRLEIADSSRIGNVGYDPKQDRLDHYMVVRAASRSKNYSLGTLLHGNGTVSYTFDMGKLGEQLLRNRKIALNVKDTNNMRENRKWGAEFISKRNWIMEPARLHLVALVQDVHTGSVLQARMIPVEPGVHGSLLKLPSR